MRGRFSLTTEPRHIEKRARIRIREPLSDRKACTYRTEFVR
jgi:hypothetical protein